MSKGVKVFTLTKVIHLRTLAQIRKHLAEGTKALYQDQGEVIRCQKCQEILNIGDRIASKRYNHTRRVQYHAKCARLVKII